ncbi:MAG: TSUP family transporter [Pseudomarimonas sp.]
MSYLLICSVALLASGLTFFSGFGLGTLLLPAFALFFPLEHAIAMTAVVHLLNGVFKFGLLRHEVDWPVVWRFALPAMLAALAGAWLLARLGSLPVLLRYQLIDHDLAITPIKLVIGLTLLVFALIELAPTTKNVAFAPKWLPLGGAISGFFGGLAGMQGALRSAFLLRLGLRKEAFIACGVACALLIDVARIAVYGQSPKTLDASLDYCLLVAAVLAAFLGAWLGNRMLKKVTLPTLQQLVAIALVVVAMLLIAGVL